MQFASQIDVERLEQLPEGKRAIYRARLPGARFLWLAQPGRKKLPFISCCVDDDDIPRNIYTE